MDRRQDHDYPTNKTPLTAARWISSRSTWYQELRRSNAATGTLQTLTNTKALTMGFYDGNTVTALWNYAQHYSMNDHSFSTTFGPSTPGAINLISGQTNGVINAVNPGSAVVVDGYGGSPISATMTQPAISARRRANQHVRQKHRRLAQCRQPHLGMV